MNKRDMLRRFVLLACATAACATAAIAVEAASTQESPAPSSPAAARASIEAGPAINWTFPVFTDKEGYRVLTCRGTAVQMKNANEVEVTDFSVIVFSGDATERVDSVLLSPQATFYPKDYRATGTKNVRLLHDDIEVVGRNWTYTHGRAVKKVSLAKDVRVTFKAQLNDILK